MDSVYSVIDSLQSNPDDTIVGKAIQRALKPLDTGEENWEMIMSVCDLVNANVQGPRDAIRSIRKQLQNKQNWTTVSMTVSIIEALVKNCGRKFHLELPNRAFLRELRLLLTNHNIEENASDDVLLNITEKNTILGMIQCWAFVFRNEKQFKPVKDLYSELVSKNVTFPDLNSSMSMIPVEATQQQVSRDHATQNSSLLSSQHNSKSLFESIKTKASNLMKGSTFSEIPLPSNDQTVRHSSDRSVMHAKTFLTQMQVTKLKSEISIVCEHVRIFDEIIESFTFVDTNAAAKVGQHEGSQKDQQYTTVVANADDDNTSHSKLVYLSNRKNDLDLMDRLYTICIEMHSRILDIVGLVDDELLALILSLVDDINNVFAKYLDFKRDFHLSQNENKTDEEGKDDGNSDTSLINQIDTPLLNLE
ncbi:hypothetical protein GJ496_011830 [Pomphorhynchus laevis]|nr:hypothetical protein GJ496_011830 [Pomphorhynchus laevis]